MKDEMIKQMVDRFLMWKLPEDFSPDGGISFKKDFNEHTEHPMKHEPVGTNLFTATQAEAMVRHMIVGWDLGVGTGDTERTFIVTDGCLWEMNKQQGAFHPHAIEVVDAETGQVRYIESGARIKFVEGKISKNRTQEEYNEHSK